RPTGPRPLGSAQGPRGQGVEGSRGIPPGALRSDHFTLPWLLLTLGPSGAAKQRAPLGPWAEASGRGPLLRLAVDEGEDGDGHLVVGLGSVAHDRAVVAVLDPLNLSRGTGLLECGVEGLGLPGQALALGVEDQEGRQFLPDVRHW